MDINFIEFMNNYKTKDGSSILGKYSSKEIFSYDFQKGDFNLTKLEAESGCPDHFYIDSFDLYAAFKAGYEAGKIHGST